MGKTVTMSELEWLSAIEYHDMLKFARPSMSERKQRLYACAVARETLHLVRDKRGIRAINVAERFADGFASKEELRVAHNDMNAATSQCKPELVNPSPSTGRATR